MAYTIRSVTHDTRQIVGASIRSELARRGLNQRDLAERLEISPPSVSRKLSGHLPFSVDELAATAEFLELPVSVLFGERVAS